MRYVGLAVVVSILVGCAGVGDKVLVDFGIKERPEGYVSNSDLVTQRLAGVGPVELKRLNSLARRGEVKYQEKGLRGKFYREVKVYESFYPLAARPFTQGTRQGNLGYIGTMEFAYRVFQSERTKSRAEAEAASATIGTGERGRETYRYRFSAGAVWDGSKGQLTKD